MNLEPLKMKRHSTLMLFLAFIFATPLTAFAKVTLECTVSGEVKYTDASRVTSEILPPEKVLVTIDDSKSNMPIKFKSDAGYSFFMGDFLKPMTVKNYSDEKYFKWIYFENTKMSKTSGSIEIDRNSLQIKVFNAWSHNKESLATDTSFSGSCNR